MEQKLFYLTAGAEGYANWLKPLGFSQTWDLEKADVLILGGGADVDPKTYGEKASSSTQTSVAREAIEKRDFAKAQELKIKTVGICRGVQLLCALSGGKLIQDVTNHAGAEHDIVTFDGMKVRVNSLHHQMINPYNMKQSDYSILAWTNIRRSAHYIGGKDKKVYLPLQFKEIESILFKNTNALGFQYHPEMMYTEGRTTPGIQWTQNTFIKFFENKL